MSREYLKRAFLLVSFSLVLLQSPDVLTWGKFKPPWQEYSVSHTESRAVRSYDLGQVHTVAIGDPIVSAYKAVFITHYKPLFPSTIVWRDDPVSHIDPLDSSWVDRKWLPKYEFDGADGELILTSKGFHRGAVGIIISEDGTIPDDPVVRVDNRGSTKRYSMPGATPSQKHFFEKVTELYPETLKFKFELIYTGKSKNSIGIVFREFYDGMARPAFSQNLTYDLDESNIIKFKTIEIEVIESTNSALTFKVLQDDDLDWLP